jgi:hypothetical protein
VHILSMDFKKKHCCIVLQVFKIFFLQYVGILAGSFGIGREYIIILPT